MAKGSSSPKDVGGAPRIGSGNKDLFDVGGGDKSNVGGTGGRLGGSTTIGTAGGGGGNGSPRSQSILLRCSCDGGGPHRTLGLSELSESSEESLTFRCSLNPSDR